MSSHFYTATMEVHDTTLPSDFDLSEERVFTITGGPYPSHAEAEDSVRDYPVYVLRFDGCDCKSFLYLSDYDMVEFIEAEPEAWSPSNLDRVLMETIDEAVHARNAAAKARKGAGQ